MKLQDLHVQSIGVYRPETWMSVEEAKAAGLCDADFPVGDLVGVQVAEGVPPVDMAVSAAREALRLAGRTSAEVDLLMHAGTFYQGPEEWSPAGYIMRELGCTDASGQVLNQGCNGVLAAMELAAGWLALQGPRTTTLITSSVNVHNSPTVDRWRSPGHGIGLGDGAAALALGAGGGIAAVRSINSTTVPQLEGTHRGALPLLEPDPPIRPKVDVAARSKENAAESVQERVELQSLLMQAYKNTMYRSLDEAEIGPKDLARVVFANVGATHVDVSVMQHLALPVTRSTWDHGRRTGHVGAIDHVAAVDHLIKAGEVSEGDHLLLVGGAAGFHISTAVLMIGDISQYAKD